ncbi:MAG: MTH895/ArsE family thioredoxin-like protein [Candidatus Spyradosoma sp.]
MKDVITIYGSGCAKCAALAEMTREALAEIGSEAEVVKETDFAKIAAAGIARTPALAVNGKLLFSGKAPDKERLKELLAERVSDARGNVAGAACACGGRRCCGGGAKNPPKKTLRRLVVWAVVLLALIAAVRLWNRASRGDADAPARPAAEQPADARDPARLELTYFTFGARCPTCVRMEKWARESVAETFPEALAAGTLVFATEAATRETVARYGLTTKSLMLRRTDGGNEISSRRLERIWELSDDERAFKSYVAETVRAELASDAATPAK